jgi:hypothetical protein
MFSSSGDTDLFCIQIAIGCERALYLVNPALDTGWVEAYSAVNNTDYDPHYGSPSSGGEPS